MSQQKKGIRWKASWGVAALLVCWTAANRGAETQLSVQRFSPPRAELCFRPHFVPSPTGLFLFVLEERPTPEPGKADLVYSPREPWRIPLRWYVYLYRPPHQLVELNWAFTSQTLVRYPEYDVIPFEPPRHFLLAHERDYGGGYDFAFARLDVWGEISSSLDTHCLFPSFFEPPLTWEPSLGGESPGEAQERMFFTRQPALAFLPEQRRLLVFGSSDRAQIWVRQSPEAGQRWDGFRTLAQGTMPVVVQRATTLYLFFKKCSRHLKPWVFGVPVRAKFLPYSVGPLYAMASPDARDWSEERLVSDLPVYGFDVAVATNGDLYVLLAVEKEPMVSLHLIRSTDGGETWSGPVVLLEDGYCNVDPTLAVHEDQLLVAFTRYEPHVSPEGEVDYFACSLADLPFPSPPGNTPHKE